jgi:hypothetical protein
MVVLACVALMDGRQEINDHQKSFSKLLSGCCCIPHLFRAEQSLRWPCSDYPLQVLSSVQAVPQEDSRHHSESLRRSDNQVSTVESSVYLFW